MNKMLKENREMKDSGIEWLGEIPKSWEIRRLRYLVNIKTGSNDTIDAVADGVYPFYVRSPKIERINTYTYDGEAILMAGDGVGAGKVFHYVNGKFACHQRVYNLHQLRDINGKFLYYYLKENFSKEVEKGTAKSTVDSIRLPMIKDFTIVLPSLYEQQIIANYLDEKVGKIDQLIAKQNQSIDKWKEYKQSLITETVTKGLNPNVEMKDSGIEWIGKIPSNWDKRKISNLFTLIGSGTTPTSSDLKYYDDGEIPWLNTGDLNDGYLYTAKNKITSHALNDYSTLKMYPEDTLIVAMYGATIGKLGITTYKTTTNQACCALSNPKNCITKFIFYWFYGNKTEIINLSRGAGQPNISQNIIKNLILFIPPLHEQQAIAEFLDEKVERVDQAIEQKQTLIKQLEEYKQSLIYECVTGKRCVL